MVLCKSLTKKSENKPKVWRRPIETATTPQADRTAIKANLFLKNFSLVTLRISKIFLNLELNHLDPRDLREHE